MDALYDPDRGFNRVTNIYSSSNDFRVNFLGDSNVPPREAVLWSSEVQFFHDVNDWRKRFFNDGFIDELNLPAAVSENLKQKQFRSDLIIYNFDGSHDTAFPQKDAAEDRGTICCEWAALVPHWQS